MRPPPPRQQDFTHADKPIDYRQSESDVNAAPGQSPAADQNVARGARYYQPRPSPAAKTVKPEELELMWRLQEMRDAGDLILQFGV